jgi:cytoskeleton protein RodZ
MSDIKTIGQQLKEARAAKKISLKQVTKVIHVKEIYLEAIEKDRFEDLPSPVQGRGFIRLYWSHLGLDPQELDELLTPPAPTAPQEPAPRSEPLTQRLRQKLNPPYRKPAAAARVESVSAPEKVETPAEKPVRPSSEVIAAIGAELRDQRERLSLTLDNIETYTHIPLHYLRALESGRMEDLPSPVQGRGMLSNYATFLNLDVDRMMLQYADALQLRRAENEQASAPEKKKREPAKVGRPSTLKSFFSYDIAFVGLLVIAAMAALVWGAGSILNYRASDQNQATERPISEVLIATQTEASEGELTPSLTAVLETPDLFSTPVPVVVNPSGVTITATISGTPPTLPNYAVNLFIVAQQRAYLKIIVDGKEAFNGRTVPNTPYSYSAMNQIQLITGNAAALQITYNGNSLGALGTTGAVLNIIFDGSLYGTPTYTATDTPTITLRPSRTPKPSNTYPPTRTKTETFTPLPTRTPKPTNTPKGTLSQ